MKVDGGDFDVDDDANDDMLTVCVYLYMRCQCIGVWVCWHHGLNVWEGFVIM